MSSEIRVNKINNRAGLGTVEYTPTGIIVSGIVTAYEFDGNFDTTPGIVVTGIATAAGIDLNGDLDVDGHTNLDNVSVAGVTTFSGAIGGTFDVDGHTNLDNVNISGMTTTTGNLYLDGGNINIGTGVTIKASGEATYSGIVTATTFSGSGASLTNLPAANITGTLPAISGANLTNLPVPTTITVADESSDTTCNPLFVTTTSGNLAPKTGTNLTFNSASGNLRAGSLFVGTATNESKTQDGLIMERNSGDGLAHITAGRSGGNYSGFEFYVAGASGVTKRHLIDYQSNFRWYDADGTTQRVRLDNVGRFMINQNTNLTGTAKLEVMGTSDTSYPQYSFAIGVADTREYNTANGPGMGIGFTYKHNSGGSYALGCGIRGFKENTTDGNYAGAMAFYTRANGAGASEGMRLTSAGDLIVHGSNLNNSSVSGQALQINGTTRPTLILRGNSSGGNTCEIQFADNSGTDSDPGTRDGLIKYEHAGTYASHMHFHTNGTERVVISHAGRFGIANSPAELAGFAENLQVTGLYSSQYAAAFKIKQSSGSLMRFATTVSGSYNLCGGITVNGSSTSFNTSSDYRLKENDVKISDGITRLKQLRPIRFNWKSDSSTTEDGFFAHEVSPVVPESVSGEKDATIDAIGEGYQKIDHSKLVPLLTAALQEAIAEIETLKTKVAALEG